MEKRKSDSDSSRQYSCGEHDGSREGDARGRREWRDILCSAPTCKRWDNGYGVDPQFHTRQSDASLQTDGSSTELLHGQREEQVSRREEEGCDEEHSSAARKQSYEDHRWSTSRQ